FMDPGEQPVSDASLVTGAEQQISLSRTSPQGAIVQRRRSLQRPHGAGADGYDASPRLARPRHGARGGRGHLEALGQRERGIERGVASRGKAGRVRYRSELDAMIP